MLERGSRSNNNHHLGVEISPMPTSIKHVYLIHMSWVYLLVPWVLVTKVLPRLRMLNMAGALTSYQSFLEKGSTL